MKVCILMGSPRKQGNTQELLKYFSSELKSKNIDCETIWLYEQDIAACTACRTCQKDWESFACRIHDSAYSISEKVLNCDVLVFATPIYSWYCTPPMKCILDRLVYGMNKYYGDKKGPSLWEGKSAATIVTCGYPVQKGTDLWEQGLIRYCRHSKLNYLGMLAAHDPGYEHVFIDEGKKQHAINFARKIISMHNSDNAVGKEDQGNGAKVRDSEENAGEK